MTSLFLLWWSGTALNIVTIIAGMLVIIGLIGSSGRQLWTLLFLITAAATTVVQLCVPFFFITTDGLSHINILQIVSIVPLTLAFMARYRFRLAGPWRGIYVVNVILTFYLHCFLYLIVDSPRYISDLNAWKPMEEALPFESIHLVTLILCAVAGIAAFIRYKPKLSDKEDTSTYISPRPEVE